MQINRQAALIVSGTAITLTLAQVGYAQEGPPDPPQASSQTAQSQAAQPTSAPEKKPEPFAFADFTWLTGNPRTKESPIDTKAFTGEFRVDTNFTYSFNKPQDDTIGGSSEIFRSGEFQLTQLGVAATFTTTTFSAG